MYVHAGGSAENFAVVKTLVVQTVVVQTVVVQTVVVQRVVLMYICVHAGGSAENVRVRAEQSGWLAQGGPRRWCLEGCSRQ